MGELHRRSRRVRLAWSIAGLSLITASTLGFVYSGPSRQEAQPVTLSISPNEGTVFGPATSGMAPFPAVSPDGRKIVFQAQVPGQDVRLWVGALDSAQAQPLPGTEGAAIPFWSPDSRAIAFTANGKLKKVDATGGPVLILCDVLAGHAAEGTWSRDGIILFANGPHGPLGSVAGLLRVSATGGKPESVTTPNKALQEIQHRAPYFLPDGRHFLFLAQPPNVFYVGSLELSFSFLDNKATSL